MLESGITEGLVNVSTPGSTAGITTIEFENGAVQDLKDAFERLAPQNIPYAHDARWDDGNGFSHVRSAFLGTSKTFPVVSKKPLLGTWQQIILVDFDNKPRHREIVVLIMG